MTQHTKHQVPSREIHRKEIKNAPYNPRIIEDTAKKKLKKNLKDRGLMGGIVWNERTGNLVSGHQRLEQLDLIEGTQDYIIRVDVVSLSEKEEIEQNIFMNNANVQGSFDNEKLKELVPLIDFNVAGLDDYDLNILGIKGLDTGELLDIPGMDALPTKKNTASLIDLDFEQEESNISDEINDLGETPEEEHARKTAEIKEKKRKALEKNENDVEEGDTYAMITFETHQAKAEFMRRFDLLPTDRYINGEQFSEIIERIE